MNSSSVTTFFLQDARKQPTHNNLCPSPTSTSVQDPLSVNEEEEEPRASTSRPSSPGQCSPNSQLKLKRRHANLWVRDKTVLREGFESIHEDARLSSLRRAPRPSVLPSHSPKPSPDPFTLNFPDGSLSFPYPPPSPSSEYFCTGSRSPTPSLSSGSDTTSPETRSSILPTTPSSEDREFFSYHDSPTHSFNPRPIIIKPLVITKHNSPAISLDSRSSKSKSPSKVTHEHPLCLLPIPEDEDSDSESDSEWWSREFSKILFLPSPAPPNPSSKARPDSFCISKVPVSSSKLPTPAVSARGLPSVQLNPSFPRRRSPIKYTIPNYPPPPVPTSPKRVSASPSPTRSFKTRPNLLPVNPTPRRPPPRSSIPADCVLVDNTFTFSDDDASAFSLSLYDHSPLSSARPAYTPKSAYSQQSFQSPRPSPFPPSFPSTPSSAFPSSIEEEFDFPVEDIQFDVKADRSTLLSLDLPTSPLDFEAGFTSRFERFSNEPHPYASADESLSSLDISREPSAGDNRELRSRWSSSTLSSVQEKNSRRSGLGPALRAYFSSSPGAKLKTRGSFSRRLGSEIPKTPKSTDKRLEWAQRESDIIVIGRMADTHYGDQLKRRGSLSPSVSDAGSVKSSSSSTSTLKRKLIQVEKFLRY